ncbi:MAG: ABC transporter ATP-binding protein/permease [Clostridiales bacterium]|nr:ABC transporter ATP-binding protein/permease [Clostridiales bacterium]
MNNKHQSFKNNFYILKLAARICPRRVAAQFISAFLSYFSWVFYSIIFIRFLFDAFEKERKFPEILTFILASAAAFFIIALFENWYENRYRPLTDQVLYNGVNKLLFEKAVAVDVGCYENPEFYNNYTRALTEAYDRTISVLDCVSTILAMIISSGYAIYEIYNLNRIVAFFVFLPVIGSFFFGRLTNGIFHKINDANAPPNRRMDYTGRAVLLQKYAKELRSSNIFTVLRGSYEKSLKDVLANYQRYWLKRFGFSFSRHFLCFPLVFCGVWIYAAYCAIVQKSLSAAGFIVLSNAIVSTANTLIGLTDNIVKSSENGIFINNIREFLNYKEKISENQGGISPGGTEITIEFKNVSFAYNDVYSLKNVSFIVRPGEKIALVGHNGAGKSTLVKLLMRLYDVTEGEILLNGINIKEYNVKAYRALFGTVFQDFQIMSMTVMENVLLGEPVDEAEREAGIQALQKSGAHEKVSSLKNGVDAMLTREFDDGGNVLSGGEYQKIAVARVFAKDRRILILDEPSSALDPIAEYEMYETLSRTYTEDKRKIAVLISHRLSSAVMADKVYLLESGSIVESGSHAELMAAGGKYSEMFNMQAKNYIRDMEGTAV